MSETLEAAAQRDAEPSGDLGMWVFIASEVLFFGALVTAYVVYRHAYLESFSAASHKLDFWLGTVNTALLLTSSFLMALAVDAAKAQHRGMAIAALALTSALGVGFLVIKGVEYHQEFVHDLAPWQSGADFVLGSGNPLHVELFFDFYYVMTGLHAVHLTIGILVVWTIVALLMTRSAAHCATAVEVTGLYWHFVDVVWVFLYPLLYLVGR